MSTKLGKMPSKLRVVLRGTPRGTTGMDRCEERNGRAPRVGPLRMPRAGRRGAPPATDRRARPMALRIGVGGARAERDGDGDRRHDDHPEDPERRRAADLLLTIGPSLLRAPAAHR